MPVCERALKLANRFKANIVSKRDSKLKYWGYVSKYFSGITREEWVKSFNTTIGSTIYVSDDFLDSCAYVQMRIIAHELVHVLQFREAPIQYPSRYASNKHYRAIYEAEAESAAYQFRQLAGGGIPDTNIYVAHYVKYGLTEDDIDTMRSIIKSDMVTLKQTGMPASPVVDIAVSIYKEKA